MPRRKQKWKQGDIVTIQRLDGLHIPAQIVDVTPQALNSLVLALFDDPQANADAFCAFDPDPDRAFSIIFSTRDSLDGGSWKVVGNKPVSIPKSLIPSTYFRPRGYVGANIYGSGIVDDFINAFYALAPWNMYYDPDYFDKMLVHPDRKPHLLMFNPKD